MAHDHTQGVTSTVAKTDDGGVQITFSIPQDLVDHAEIHALQDLAKTVAVPGFRKGKAPVEKIKQTVPAEKLLEKTLMQILPQAFGQAAVEHKLKPALYPRFEVISQNPWQVRAVTCEIAPFELGDYKTIVNGALSASSLWTPDKGDPKNKVEPPREEKEQKILTALLDSIKIDLPKMLIDEEVNVRLAQLLERIEKLGLTLEGYLGSIGKSVDGLRTEYEEQVKQAVLLELILNKMAEAEKIAISEEEINQVVAMTTAGKKDTEVDPAQKSAIASVLRRRAVLDRLIGTL